MDAVLPAEQAMTTATSMIIAETDIHMNTMDMAADAATTMPIQQER